MKCINIIVIGLLLAFGSVPAFAQIARSRVLWGEGMYGTETQELSSIVFNEDGSVLFCQKEGGEARYDMEEVNEIEYVPMQNFSVSIGQCFMVGDSIEADILFGANAENMGAFLLTKDVEENGIGKCIEQELAEVSHASNGVNRFAIPADAVISRDRYYTLVVYARNAYDKRYFEKGYCYATKEVYLKYEDNFWNSIGKGKLSDMFLGESSFEVEIEQNAYDASKYRVINLPYDNLYGRFPEADRAFEFKVYGDGEAVSDNYNAPCEGFVLFEPFNTGYYDSAYDQCVYHYHPYQFEAWRSNSTVMQKNRVVKYKEDGTPGLIYLSSYWYMPGNGGWNYTDTDGAIKITMPGFEQ